MSNTPWTVLAVGSPSGPIVVVDSDHDMIAKVLGDRIEDARLMAAAPELMTAAQSLLARIDSLAGLWVEGVLEEQADALRAAVAKAEGGR